MRISIFLFAIMSLCALAQANPWLWVQRFFRSSPQTIITTSIPQKVAHRGIVRLPQRTFCTFHQPLLCANSPQERALLENQARIAAHEMNDEEHDDHQDEEHFSAQELERRLDRQHIAEMERQRKKALNSAALPGAISWSGC